MAFKMKGHTLPGIKQRSAKSGDGRAKSSAFQVAGAFITDVDELTGEETEKRATYEDTRKAEEEGKKVKYTNKEEGRRSKEEIKRLQDKSDKLLSEGKDDKGAKAHAEAVKSQLIARKKYVRENRQSKEDIEARKSDRAAQDKMEIAAINKAKKDKGDKSNPKVLDAWKRRQVVKDKAKGKDTSKSDDSGISGGGFV